MRTLEENVEKMVNAAYVKTHFSRDLIALFGNRTLMRISLGVLGVFLPIFFYKEFNYDLEVVLAIFIALYALYMLFIPVGVQILSRIGTRKMIMLGMCFGLVSIMALYFFPLHPAIAAVAYVITNAIHRTLYWVPYHVDLSHALDKTMRGRQLAILGNIASVILVLVPLAGGVIITAFGFSTVFLISICIMLISMAPLWFLNTTFEQYSWRYIETFKHLFARRNRALFLAHASNGAQGAVTLFFWPVYVFMLLDERYTVLGLIASLTIVVVVALRWLIGELFDRWSHERVLMVGVLMATTGWISKIFVQTPFQVMAADSYHNAGRTVNTLSFDAVTYEQSADNGRYVDEYTALKEMALSLGRVAMLLVIFALASLVDIRIVFVIAATVALFMLVLNKKVSLY